MEIKVELPKKEDFEKVNSLAKQVHDLHVAWRPDLFLDVEEVIAKVDFEKMIQEKEIYVSKVGEEIVGYVTFKITEKESSIVRYQKLLRIEAICVDEKYRGKGIGTKLLEFAKEIAKQNGCTDLYLTANEENTSAIKMYEKFGFRVKNIAYSMPVEE